MTVIENKKFNVNSPHLLVSFKLPSPKGCIHSVVVSMLLSVLIEKLRVGR